MRGASRASLDEAVRRLDDILSSTDAAVLGDELFQVVGLLGREHSLRRWLADSSVASESKTGLIGRVLESQVSPATVMVVSDVVQGKWSKARDLVDAIEHLAVFAVAASAERDQRTDELEDELFRFGRIVAAEPRLRTALTQASVPVERRRALVEELLSGKANPATQRLVTQVVAVPRGRTLEQGLDAYGRLVAERAKRFVAVVRTAVPLSEAQASRLRELLSGIYGRPIHLNTDITPEVVGGLSIRVGDEVIDGTIAGRLEEVRRRLAG